MRIAHLLSWLNQAKSAFLALKHDESVILVLGNESAVVSSVLHAYVNRHQSTLVVPVIDLERRDFRLRGEIIFSGVNCFNQSLEDFLVFRDHIPMEKLRNTKLLLTDHNVLSDFWSGLGNNVKQIIDHHIDQGQYPKAKRTIEMVGSCSTLIAEEALNSNEIEDTSVLKFLLSPILVDTLNLKFKATPKDIEIASLLISQIKRNDTSFSQSDYFDQLFEAKNNVTHFTNEELLRRDYKQWELSGYGIGISSVPLGLDQWVDREHGLGPIADAIETRMTGLDLYVIMTSHVTSTGEFKRQLLFEFPEKKSSQIRLGKFLDRELFLARFSELIEIQKISYGNCCKGVFAFDQLDSMASRKQIQPVIAKILSEL